MLFNILFNKKINKTYIKTLPLLIVFASVLLLQGCVIAAVVGTAAAIGTKVATDPRTVGTQVDDNTLELRVKRALFRDKQIKKETKISAIAYQGKVLLVGQAPNSNLILRINQIAMKVKGITELYNEIRCCPPIRFNTASLDFWITAKLNSQLLSSNKIKFSNIKVITENSEVFLLGIVTEHEGKAAADIASRINGVKSVITAFTYIR